MSTHEPPTNPEPTPQPGGGDVVASPRSSVTPGTWIFVIVAAILAGVGSWFVLERTLDAYKASFEVRSGPYPTAEDAAQITQARIASGTLAFGVTGALFGLMLGVAGGLSRKSNKATILAGVFGLVLGGLAEGGAGRLSLWLIYHRFDPQTEDMLQSLLGHLGLWSAVGLTGGLAFGLGLGGRGRWWRATIGGLVGAGVATVVYEFLGALVFATHGTHQPLADTPETRALAQILIPLGAAIGALLSASDPKPKPKTTPAQD
jgi:hypothetical protein